MMNTIHTLSFWLFCDYFTRIFNFSIFQNSFEQLLLYFCFTSQDCASWSCLAAVPGALCWYVEGGGGGGVASYSAPSSHCSQVFVQSSWSRLIGWHFNKTSISQLKCFTGKRFIADIKICLKRILEADDSTENLLYPSAMTTSSLWAVTLANLEANLQK